MPPKKVETRKKRTKPMSSKYRAMQAKSKPKSRRILKPKFIVRETKKETSFIPIRTIYRDHCESAWNEYKQGKTLGRGLTGSVFALCDEKKKCPYVLKVEEFSTFNIQNFTHEVEYQHKARAFAPKIFDAWVCEHVDGMRIVGFIVMERMDGTLKDYLLENHPITMEFAKKVMKTIRSHINKLHKMGIVHGDIHTGNIYYKGKKWFLGDFGEARYIFSLQPPVRKLVQMEDEQSLERVQQKLENAYFETLIIKKL